MGSCRSDEIILYPISTSEPSIYSQYLYDSSGRRVKKLVRKQGNKNIEITVYIDGMFEYDRIMNGNNVKENNTLNILDDTTKIACVRIGNPFPDDKTPAIKYQLGDHIGSNNVVVDDDAHLIDREEYYVYGESSFGSFAKKRYRFTGKERDEEGSLIIMVQDTMHHGLEGGPVAIPQVW